jgi:hypothetical protein
MFFDTTRQIEFGINRTYITSRPERLYYKPCSRWSLSKNVTFSHGQVLFRVDHSRGSRTTSVCDGHGAKIFLFRSEPHWFKPSTYYAHSPLGGFNGFDSNSLWQMNRKSDPATAKTSVISFANGVASGRIEVLEYKQSHRGRLGGELIKGGQVVARVERTGMWSTKCAIDISRGADMALVIGIVAAVDDKIRNESSAT